MMDASYFVLGDIVASVGAVAVVVILIVFELWYSRAFDEISYPDDMPQLDRPVITLGLISICVAVFALQYAFFARNMDVIVMQYGMVPAVLFGGALPPDSALAGYGRMHGVLTLITSAFLHGNLDHLAGNMLFLWIFGRHLDDVMDWFIYVPLVLICAVVSSLAVAVLDPHGTIPSLGASGFISGLMGTYLVLFPKAKLYQYLRIPITLQPITFALPAWVYLLGWVGLQIFFFYTDGDKSGIAFSAHISGFFVGAVLGWLLDRIGLVSSYGPDVIPAQKTAKPAKLVPNRNKSVT